MNHEEPKSRKKILIIISLIAVSATMGYFSYEAGYFSNKIQVSEIPLSLLNQYDLVCKARDNQQLCIYNSTGNTIFNGEGTLVLPQKDGISEHIDLYEIKAKNGTCIKEYRVGWDTQPNNCNFGAGFPKKTWTITPLQPTGNSTLFAFRNGTAS